jgi:catechol 2,3-dioxygenase-like lactoylglutathione lyase family enzyme
MKYRSLLPSLLLMCFSIVYSAVSNSDESPDPVKEFGITANNFMFYHENLEAAVAFYEDVLGLYKVLDYGTAVMFQIADTSYITLVRGSQLKHNLSGEHPVTVSLVTDELEKWYTYLSQQSVQMLHKNMKGGNSPEHSFIALDPAGYYLQFLRINSHAENIELLTALDQVKPLPVKPKQQDSHDLSLGIKATITSFYYQDLESVERLFEHALGFPMVNRKNGARTYHTSTTGYFRVVEGTDGLHKPSKDLSQRKGVMLSLYTDNVDAWFDIVTKQEYITMRTPKMIDIENIREFSFNDPGDYAVEFNYFKATEANRLLLKSMNR